MTSLCTLFYLLSMLSYLDYRLKGKKWYLGLCIASAIFAIATKEIALTIPFVFALYEPFLPKRTDSYHIIIPTALLAVFAAFIVSHTISSNQMRMFFSNIYSRLITEARVICHYISLFFYSPPNRLNLDPDILPSTSLFYPMTTILSVAAIMTILIATFVFYHRKQPVYIGMAWFFITCLPEAAYYNLDIQADHRVYLPFIGISIALAVMTTSFKPGLKHLKHALCYLFLFILPIETLWTHDRNKSWSNMITIWSDTVKKSPNKARAHTNLGYAYEISGIQDKAITEYKAALRVNPKHLTAVFNLGLVYEKANKPQLAIEVYENTSKVVDKNPRLYYELGRMYEKNNEFTRAEKAYIRASELGKQGISYNIGLLYQKQEKWEMASRYYKKASESNPDNYWVHLNLGVVYYNLKEFTKAENEYLKARKINRLQPESFINMALLLLKMKRNDEALSILQEAQAAFPDNFLARFHAGNIYMLKHEYKKAENEYLEATKIDASIKEAYKNLSEAYRLQGKTGIFTKKPSHYDGTIKQD